MLTTNQYQNLLEQLQKLFFVDFVLAESKQVGLEATFYNNKPTIIINSGFVNHSSTGIELLCMNALHEIAHFYGFSRQDKLILKTMINETWADYWAFKIGLPILLNSAKERSNLLKNAILQLRNYQKMESTKVSEQLRHYQESDRPEVHPPINLRIELFESLLTHGTFPDFVVEARRMPH